MHSFPSPLIHSLDSGSNSSVFIFLYLCSFLYAPYFYIYQLKWVKLVILWTWKNRDTLAYWWSGQLLPSVHLPLLTSPLGSSIKCSWPDGYAFLDSFTVTCCHSPPPKLLQTMTALILRKTIMITLMMTTFQVAHILPSLNFVAPLFTF